MSYQAGVILMLARYIPAVQTMGVTIQNAKRMHRPRAVIYFVIACVNVAASIGLIRLWGVVGTSLGTLAAVALGAGLFMNLYYHFRIGLNVKTFWRALLRWTLMALLLCGGAGLVIRGISLDSWPRLAAFVLIYSGLYLALLWTLGMRPGEKKEIRQALAGLRGRKG